MSLSTLDILTELSDDNWSKTHFLGVFPINRKPKIKHYPASLVLNNQKHDQNGEHWIAIYFENKSNCEFFDSFGNHPDSYNIMPYLRKYSKRVYFLTYPLQHNQSYFCGYYCIYFLMLRCRKIKYLDIVNLFDRNNLHYNDFLIKQLL